MKQFQTIKQRSPKNSFFDLSHEVKMTGRFGKLYPVYMDEIIPGDEFRVKSNMMIRVLTMLAPMMHRVNVFMHWFFVPYRLIWDDWEKFITGDFDGEDTTDIPLLTGDFDDYASAVTKTSLLHYLGLPYNNSGGTDSIPPISALPSRAYCKIYEDYYMDENLQTITWLTTSADTSITTTVYRTLKSRNWEKDYFTSALPWAQRGSQVSLPLGDTAPLSLSYPAATRVVDITGAALPTAGENVEIGTSKNYLSTDLGGSDKSLMIDVTGTTEVDLSSATSATISVVRSAYALQRWQEKNARGGVRYTELILAHFNIRSKDARLQRAEYLGGSKIPIVISEVLQTSETNTTPLGDFAGHGYAAGQTDTWHKFFTEHGILMGIMSVMPRTGYYQGVPKYFSKTDRFDFYWPDFAHIGEQELKSRELYLSNSETNNETDFGYQPRYEEYRYKNDRVVGEFTDSLDYWHLARDVSSNYALNSAFVTFSDDQRFLAVQDDEDYLLCQLWLDIQAKRPIAKMGNPI